MRRLAGSRAAVLPALALILGPWLGFAPLSARPPAEEPRPVFVDLDAPAEAPSLGSAPAARGGVGGCNCRTVTVNMRNVVTGATVRTGDATVVNYSITYVSALYGDREVEVEQEAEAISGDAIAGQLIGVDARGPGCVNVQVNAFNRVEDSVVRTGDATAINQAIVLLDPGVSRGDLEIEIDQEAVAISGDAIAGQVIGITGGPGRNGCGGRVDLVADNLVRDTSVRTGEASFLNEATIEYCAQVGCAAELLALLGKDAEFHLCSSEGCRRMRAEELVVALAAEASRKDDDEDEEEDEDEAPVTAVAAACATPTPPPPAAPPAPPPPADPPAEASPSPSPEASPAPSDQAPPPPHSPAPNACPTPAPSASPAPSPGLLVAAEGDPSGPPEVG